MRKKDIQNSLQFYLSKLKNKKPSITLPTSSQSSTTAAAMGAAGRLLLSSVCRHPKTPSFAVDRPGTGSDREAQTVDRAATLSDVDRFLVENFNSLYVGAGPDSSSDDDDDDNDVGDGGDISLPPSAALLRSSGRFFVFPGSLSSSLAEEARLSLSAATSSSLSVEGTGGGVAAVMTFSKDPYDDFRRSMQDMVEARHADPSQPLDWEFVEELLFCFLELNDRAVHKYILRAFTDLAVGFRRRQIPARRRRRRRRAAVVQVKGMKETHVKLTSSPPLQ